MHSFITPTPPTLTPSPDVLEITPDKSISIEEIRQIITFVSKKPSQSPTNTVIVHDAHLLTLPAQNAFLKTLEEPPAHSQIYLVTSYPDFLLPTIISRCQVLSDIDIKKTLTFSPDSLTLITQLIQNRVGDRLQILDAKKFTRESALEFLNDLEVILHKHLHLQLEIDQLNQKNIPKLTILVWQLKTYLKSNVNLKLILSHFALNL